MKGLFLSKPLKNIFKNHRYSSFICFAILGSVCAFGWWFGVFLPPSVSAELLFKKKKGKSGQDRQGRKNFQSWLTEFSPSLGGFEAARGSRSFWSRRWALGGLQGLKSPSVAAERGSTGIILGFVLPNNCSLFPHHVSSSAKHPSAALWIGKVRKFSVEIMGTTCGVYRKLYI